LTYLYLLVILSNTTGVAYLKIKVFLDYMTLEGGTEWLSRNIGTKLPFYDA